MLIFVDCEAVGPCPSVGTLTEFGAVEYVPASDPRRSVAYCAYPAAVVTGDPGPVGRTFHGRIYDDALLKGMEKEQARAASGLTLLRTIADPRAVFLEFDQWLVDLRTKGGVSFVSDNVAYDWMWICDGLWRHVGRCRFGHSGRRISDFYAGLTGDFRNTQSWKRLRVTPHDHNPVHDAIGNVEAFDRMLRGERA